MSRPRVVVVGGGLAGLSAAVACADGGAAVTVLEARPRLGGATWSFTRNGLRFDNGQHVHLRCCTRYRAFLDRLGTAELAPLRGELAIPVLEARPGASPKVAWIRRDRLPAPLHLGRSLLSYDHLPLADRLKLMRPALRLRLVDLDDAGLDETTFGAFLASQGQSATSVERLWDLITLPTTNLRSGEVSLALAAKVFQTGLLTSSDAADIGWSSVPLADLHARPAASLLAGLGAQVRQRAKVTSLLTEDAESPAAGPAGGRVSGVMVDGERLEADAVVLAVQHESAAELLPPGSHPDPRSLSGLGRSAIVNVHVVFDRKVMPYQLAAGVGTPVQYVFDRTEAAGLSRPAGGQVLAVSVSGAGDEVGDRPAALIERYVRALRELFPVARHAEVLDAVVTREHDATFRGAPGTRRLRPGPVSGLANLAIAGAWTDTGWPATMESAVRSGHAAAAAALASVGHVRTPVPDREEVRV